MGKKIKFSLQIVLIGAVLILVTNCADKNDFIGKSLSHLSSVKIIQTLSAVEATRLLKGKTITGESAKTREMKGYFTQKFNDDGSWVFTFFKTMSHMQKHLIVGKWRVREDGVFCTQKKPNDVFNCNKKIYKSEGSYFTVNTDNGKVWSNWKVNP